MAFVIKNIHMTLDADSIDNAIREIRHIEQNLKPAMMHLIEHLAEKGVEIAKAELIFMPGPPYMTGDLQESIQYHSEKDSAYITAGEGLSSEYGSYAVFVEFGTGWVGENNPHDLAGEVGYEYDVNGHGMKGWWYPAPWGWWTPATGKHAGEKMAWTDGMPARPFMYHTLSDLTDEAEVTGGRIIAEYLAEF